MSGKQSMRQLRNKVDELPKVYGKSALLKKIDSQIAYGNKYAGTDNIAALFYKESRNEYDALKKETDRREQEKADAENALRNP